MIKTQHICDCCQKPVLDSKNFYRIKVKSNAFVSWVNQEDFFADRQTFDICRNCINDFKEYINKTRKI